jgi:hypothetical protein
MCASGERFAVYLRISATHLLQRLGHDADRQADPLQPPTSATFA